MEHVSMDVVRRLAEVTARMNGGSRLEEILQVVADGAVDALGFGISVVSHRLPDGSFEVIAAHGPSGLAATLSGTVTPAHVMRSVLDQAEPWAALWFAPQGSAASQTLSRQLAADERICCPGSDVVLAPIDAADGTRLGVLTVGIPTHQLAPDDRRPDPLQAELLQIFASHAATAIQRVRLVEELAREQAEVQREQERERRSAAAFRFAFEGSAGGMATVSLDDGSIGTLTRVNNAFADLVDRSQATLAGSRWFDLMHPDDLAAAATDFDALVTGRRRDHRAELRLVRPGGTVTWVGVTSTVVQGHAALEPFLLMHVDSIDAFKQRESRLAHEAEHDPLTGLLNRRTVLRELDAAVARPSGHRVLLFADLDRFKQVNDEYGHATGDRVLREVADRLTSQMRPTDKVGRLGGDEFVVIADGVRDEDVDSVLDRIARALAEPLTSVRAELDVSIGAAPIDGTASAAELLAVADRAMYAVKQRRRTVGQAIR